MFDTFRNAWKIPELRKKILFTLMILVIFRLGCAISVPYVNVDALELFRPTSTPPSSFSCSLWRSPPWSG